MVAKRAAKHWLPTVEMWGIKDPKTDKIWKYNQSIREQRKDAQEAFAKGTGKTWLQWYRQGWRAVRVSVREL